MKRMLGRFWQDVGTPHFVSKLDTTEQNTGAYNRDIEDIRLLEYPSLIGTTYLDHAGTTPYAKSAIEKWTTELTTNLFGNPHSASASSQLSTRRVDDIRLKVLKFFHANPEDFDVVFVANATAAIKLVAEAFRDSAGGFRYAYHSDSHTSLIGCRELAVRGVQYFEDDRSLESWISELDQHNHYSNELQLVAYPGQSNMTGRRLPLSWSGRIRRNASRTRRRVYTLFDAASLASTSPLDLSDSSSAPDFIALSFYKIFGFPDLGALLLRKESADVLMQKRYFAGGTVDAVITSGEIWHAKKSIPHAALEEGTLPFHNIIALEHAMAVHTTLFGPMERVSKHVQFLRNEAKEYLKQVRHANNNIACEVYEDGQAINAGPLIAFNLKDSVGKIISASEVEKLCIIKGIQLRTGGLCNPGGIARHLHLSRSNIRSNYDSGYRCGGESDLMDGRATGALRISFGAMSTRSDLQNFIDFIEEYYVERCVLSTAQPDTSSEVASFYVEALSVFPVKSCAAFNISSDQKWLVTPKGLAWDREWCLVHEGTNAALSQKRYPKMALLQPHLDLLSRKMTISIGSDGSYESIEIDMDDMTSATVVSTKACTNDTFNLRTSKVCDDLIPLLVYNSLSVNNFFSRVLGVPCCLARYPATGLARTVNIRRPSPDTSPPGSPTRTPTAPPQIMLANESPMLIVSRSSVNELNRQIQKRARDRNEVEAPRVSADSFRANIVVAEHATAPKAEESPYEEDRWTSISISSQSSEATQNSATDALSDDTSSRTRSLPGSFISETPDLEHASQPSSTTSFSRDNTTKPSVSEKIQLDILGPCQRCQMVSIDQSTAKPQQEPFSTLAKTRRKGDGRVWFGMHSALGADCLEGRKAAYVQIGDVVVPQYDDGLVRRLS